MIVTFVPAGEGVRNGDLRITTADTDYDVSMEGFGVLGGERPMDGGTAISRQAP